MRAGVSSVPIEDARIDEIAAIIAREFEPTEIILFGSYAKGEQNADSDVDLLVVFKHVVDKAAQAVRIRRAIGRVDSGVDIVVSSERELAEWQGVKGTIYYYARKEGRPLYGRKPGLRS